MGTSDFPVVSLQGETDLTVPIEARETGQLDFLLFLRLFYLQFWLGRGGGEKAHDIFHYSKTVPHLHVSQKESV